MSKRTSTVPNGHVAATATGVRGAVATAHPEATNTAVELLEAGGSAVDSAIAAQAVICVVMPQAAGLGGDMLALVRNAVSWTDQGSDVCAVNGSGASPGRLSGPPATTGGTSVTVPGLVDAWLTMHRRWGRLPLHQVLARAIKLADEGIALDQPLAQAVAEQRERLVAGGALGWSLLAATDQEGAAGPRWQQAQLATLLEEITVLGRRAFYGGAAALAIAESVERSGGVLDRDDLDRHRTQCPTPINVAWGPGSAYVQPPMSQGVLLALALQTVRQLRGSAVPLDDHVLVEVTEAAFAHRSQCGRGATLLARALDIDLHRSSGRGGPRAYLHTAGVATADASGQVVSSLVSVFDDFGSGVFVPELGIVLNNRAAGFTDGDNAPAPGARPVHTLAPALLTDADGGALAVSTPGADGQVQTLLQVLVAVDGGRALADAVSAPRWRSQDGELLVEDEHPAAGELRARGHRTVASKAGADVFGAVVAAGVGNDGPFAVADWRRQTSAGGADDHA